MNLQAIVAVIRREGLPLLRDGKVTDYIPAELSLLMAEGVEKVF